MTKHLSGGNIYKCVLLIILFLTTVGEIVGTHYVFEKYDVHSHILSAIRYRLCYLRTFKDVYIRVACGNAPMFVVVFYFRDIDYLVHIVEGLMFAKLNINKQSSMAISKRYTSNRKVYK